MTTRKIPGRGGSGSARRISSGPARLRILLALSAAAAAAAALVACSSAGASPSPSGSSSSPAAAAANTVKTATIAGATVLTSSKGFALYSPHVPSSGGCSYSPFVYCFRFGVHRAVTAGFVMLDGMADFLAVIGIVVFVAAMLGLIWGLERI